MVWLVFETFILMLAFVAMGIAIGIGLKSAFGGREPAVAGAASGPLEEAPPTVPTPVVMQRPSPRMAAPAASEAAGADAAAPTGGAATAEGPVSLSAAEAVIDPAKATAADQVGVRPPPLPGPRDGAPDDLKRIRGIGPQNEARLAALGIFHFDQIAAWSPDEARWVGSYLAFPGRIERENWVGQAKTLAG
jgi:predicted flap endonuclease-1-like 5' DNA nuclease